MQTHRERKAMVPVMVLDWLCMCVRLCVNSMLCGFGIYVYVVVLVDLTVVSITNFTTLYHECEVPKALN